MAPRVAAQEPPGRQRRSPDEALRAQRVDGVVRARRLVLAGRRKEGPEGRTPEPDRRNAEPVHQAATLVIDRTSSTRSPSQSKPFAATASGRPERTIRT